MASFAPGVRPGVSLVHGQVSIQIPDPGAVDVAVGLGGSAVGAFLTTLLVGGILVALAPEYVERMTGVVQDDPSGVLVYGVLASVVVALVTVGLAVTVVGLVAAVPIAVVAAVVWAVGSAVATLAVADRLLDREEGWLKPLVVAAAVNGALTLTGVGGLVAFCIGAAGFGAVVRDYLD
jgi:hypothetical protein